MVQRRFTRREVLRHAGAITGAASVAAGGLGQLPAAADVLGSAGPTAGAGGQVWKMARVWASRDTARLLDGFDETHHVFDDGSIELLLWPGDVARLEATGLPFEITVTDVVARDAAARALAPGRPALLAPQPGETADGEYRVLADFEAEMKALAEQHPDKARVFALPEESRQGRTVWGIEICTDVTRQDGRPVYYMDGIHHAREWPAAEMPIMWAYDLLEAYGTDERITTLVDHVRHIIVPVMNPDGYHYSRSAMIDNQFLGNPATGNSYWRKNRRQDAPHALDAVIDEYGVYGVDPNRNHAFGWGGAGSSASTSSDTHRGDAPLSEPENRNVAHILRSHHVPAMITHHTYGRWVLYAYSWTADDVTDQALVEGLGEAMATFNGYTAQKSIDLYIHTGVCVDYGYGSFSSISYTFEHGTSFHPDYASSVPGFYAANREAFILLGIEGCLAPEQRPAVRALPDVLGDHGYDADALHHGILTGQVVDADGNGVRATMRITKDFETPLWNDGDGSNPTGMATLPESLATEMTTTEDGRFTWHVNPSSRPHVRAAGETEAYTLIAVADDGRASTPVEVVVGRGDRPHLGTIVVA